MPGFLKHSSFIEPETTADAGTNPLHTEDSLFCETWPHILKTLSGTAFKLTSFPLQNDFLRCNQGKRFLGVVDRNWEEYTRVANPCQGFLPAWVTVFHRSGTLPRLEILVSQWEISRVAIGRSQPPREIKNRSESVCHIGVGFVAATAPGSGCKPSSCAGRWR